MANVIGHCFQKISTFYALEVIKKSAGKSFSSTRIT